MITKKQVQIIDNIHKNKNNVITKGNPLVEFPYKLSLAESKILLFVISLIQPDDNELNLHRFKVKDLVDFLNLKTKNYDEIRNTIKSLQSKILTINKEDGGVLDVNWMSSAEYFKGGDIEIELSVKLSPYLLQLKQQFISYKLFNILNLSSIYSIRIYEFLKKYEKIGEKIYSIEELKKIFQIENEYNLYGHFKKRVLDTAMRDLKVNTDLYFNYTEIKQGKKVIKIHLKIYKNKREAEDKIILGEGRADLFEKIRVDLNIKEKILKDIFETYSLKKIQGAFQDSINKYKAGKITNPEGYFLKLVKDENYLRKEGDLEEKKKEKRLVEENEISLLIERDKKEKEIKEQLDLWITNNTIKYNELLEKFRIEIIEEYSTRDFKPSNKVIENLILGKTRIYIKSTILN